MTHQISKAVCGVDTLLRIRRWWALRKLRGHWRHEQKFAKCYRQHKWARRVFNIEWNYLFLKHSARVNQQRGKI
ncbi:hypothetical protein [Xenorhabdus bovienii]|uniref:hypothetical protein n=1 Tax=Xenorhabdus bovienii TaxID=40576 RepID=UPI00061D38E2|nr:hypothetical protein [Xenorhabdus bovienii]